VEKVNTNSKSTSYGKKEQRKTPNITDKNLTAWTGLATVELISQTEERLQRRHAVHSVCPTLGPRQDMSLSSTIYNFISPSQYGSVAVKNKKN